MSRLLLMLALAAHGYGQCGAACAPKSLGDRAMTCDRDGIPTAHSTGTRVCIGTLEDVRDACSRLRKTEKGMAVRRDDWNNIVACIKYPSDRRTFHRVYLVYKESVRHEFAHRDQWEVDGGVHIEEHHRAIDGKDGTCAFGWRQGQKRWMETNVRD